MNLHIVTSYFNITKRVATQKKKRKKRKHRFQPTWSREENLIAVLLYLTSIPTSRFSRPNDVGRGLRLCPLLRTASSSRSKNLRQRRPPWRKLSEHTFRISRPMFPSGPRYIVITKRLALREGYDSPSPSPLSPSSSAEYQYDTLLYFWFLFESFLFPSLTFPRNRRCSSSTLATLIIPFPFFFLHNVQFCVRRYIWVRFAIAIRFCKSFI